VLVGDGNGGAVPEVSDMGARDAMKARAEEAASHFFHNPESYRSSRRKLFLTKLVHCRRRSTRLIHRHLNNNKETSMTTTLTIGKRLVPLEHIVLVEPFDPATQTRMQTDRPYRTRVLLLDRESLLTEEALDGFVDAHGFRRLSADGVATNPAIYFRVEAYEVQDEFKTTKPYQSRLSWTDAENRRQSKLLLATPENALAVVVRGEADIASAEGVKPNVSRRLPRRRAMPVPR
jgi:hypothetical protein